MDVDKFGRLRKNDGNNLIQVEEGKIHIG